MKLNHTLFTRSLSFVALSGTVALFVAWNTTDAPVRPRFHTQAEFDAFARGTGLPVGENQYFKTSAACEGCHGHDPSGQAMVTEVGGIDVNVVDDWRSTMMGNSARDPFWRAKVSHEGIVNPAHQAALEDKCTSCHAPAGRHYKHMMGLGQYSVAELENDPLGLDGVSCVPCHMQSPTGIGHHFSGDLQLDTLGHPIYGPYGSPDDPTPLFGSPMTAFVGYEPQWGAHVADAGMCAGCHTLATETADLSGNLTGQVFFEQATYHEWLNSRFNDKEHPDDGITCQGCHLPRTDDGVRISANYLFLTHRSPFGQHHFAGANTFMLNMLKGHIDPLGLSATETQFDSTISRTQRMLRSGLLLETTLADRDADTAYVEVKLSDLAGHKFPSGYPARRAWVELLVTNAEGDTVFHNGGYDGTYEVIGHDPSWEPHHDVITNSEDVQIYEMVMGDVNGDKTTVLERAATKLKDNRLVPELFSTQHYSYDTSAIANVPASDVDFNHDALGVEGSGSDIVHYHVPLEGNHGLIHVQARVWYQSAPPKWMEELFSNHSAPIDTFRTMYEAADNTPFLVAEGGFDDLSTGIDGLGELGVRIAPNPVIDGMLTITGLDQRVRVVEVYDVRGGLVAERDVPTSGRLRVPLPADGTYMVVFRTNERSFVQRVVAVK